MRTVALLFVVALMLLLAAPAQGFLTPIFPSPNEPDLLGPNINNGSEGILDYLYGLGNLTRVDDLLDQGWNSLDGGAVATAKFAGNQQNFGYMDPHTHLFSSLINYTGGSGYINIPSSPFLVGDSTPFRFALRSGGTTFTSLMVNNGGEDHMVTWRLTNAPVLTYILAWEDVPLAGSDKDYNDWVVEVASVDPIPEPGSLLLLGLGLLGIGGFSLRRKPV